MACLTISAISWWRVLPVDHPTHIYMTGRATEREVLRDSTSHGHSKFHTVTLSLGLILTWCVLDAAAHRMHLNPLESMFDSFLES